MSQTRAVDGSLAKFAEGLEQSVGNWDSVRALFLDHLRGDFLEHFVSEEICTSADNPDHVVTRGVGQGSFTFINTPNFEYSVRVLSPFHRTGRLVKWAGMPQMIAVRGPGVVVVRTLRVPEQCDIEQFVPNVQISEFTTQEARDGDVVITEDPKKILDIQEVSAPCVVEILTCRHGAPTLVWTFSSELMSLYAEQSSLAASRFRNILLLTQAEALPIPDEIYALALKSGSPQVSLLAIQSMVAAGHPESFSELQHARESEHQWLRRGATELLDALFAARGQ